MTDTPDYPVTMPIPLDDGRIAMLEIPAGWLSVEDAARIARVVATFPMDPKGNDED